jgi:hypothetical protein
MTIDDLKSLPEGWQCLVSGKSNYRFLVVRKINESDISDPSTLYSQLDALVDHGKKLDVQYSQRTKSLGLTWWQDGKLGYRDIIPGKYIALCYESFDDKPVTIDCNLVEVISQEKLEHVIKLNIYGKYGNQHANH